MRIAVLGTSGSGKSSFARRLARLIGAPHVELDALNWQSGWRGLNSQDPQEFRRKVEAALSPESWVSDGNYRRVRDLVLARATHIVWLDYSRWVVMNRVLRRSLARAMTRQELWPGTGNREDLSRWLDKEHPLRWAWDTYEGRRQRFTALFADPATAGLHKHRLHRPSEAEPLIRALQAEAGAARTSPAAPPAPTLRIRPAGETDIALLGPLKLRASLAWGDHVAELQASWEARIFPPEHVSFAAVAEDAGRLVGFVTVIPGPEGRAELEDLFVEPDCWRRGIGRRLLAEAEGRAQAAGAGVLQVIANGRAQAFYEACGFNVVGVTETQFASASKMEKPLAPLAEKQPAQVGDAG